MIPRLAMVAALALALLGCGGPSTMTMTYGPRGRLIDAPVRPRRPAAWERAVTPAPVPIAGRPFADSPISPFAERLADFALAAIEGRPLPAAPLPTRAPLDAPEIDWSEHAQPRPRQLDVLAVAIEVELVLKRGDPTADASGAERWGTLRTTLAITRNGIRVVSLRPGVMSPDPPGGTPPPGLEGLVEVSRHLIADLRRGDVSAYELTEADRRVLANDAVWAQVHEDGPPLGRASEIAAMLEGLPDAPLAYWLDDLGVLARDEEGRLYSLSLELDPRRGTFALSTSPLIEVRRLWPQ